MVLTPDPDWRHQYDREVCDPEYAIRKQKERTVTAPRTAEQSISLMSAGISALDGVAMTDDEKERVWALVNKAMERLK